MSKIIYVFVCFIIFMKHLYETVEAHNLNKQIFNDTSPERIKFQIANKSYTIVTYSQLDVLGAIHFCAREGQYLLSLETEDENDQVYKVLQDYLDTNKIYTFWSSGHRIGPQDWTWLTTGTLLIQSKWIEDAPSTDKSKNCVTLQYTSWGDSKTWWFDSYCNITRLFICESKAC